MISISKIMRTHVITASLEDTASKAAKIMSNNKVGSVVLMENNKPIGIITDTDIVSVVARGLDPNTVKLKEIKQDNKFITASPSDRITEVTKKMVSHGIRRMPVVENGELKGIISDKEILLVSPELLEVMSEKLKARVAFVTNPTVSISGICENCEEYSDHLLNAGGEWLCEDCR